jgi:DNA-binding NarL/FixJ family response regulator
VCRHRGVQLGDDDGFAVCDAVTRIRPGLAVVLTSAEKDHEHAAERVESCGARGFVRKEHLPRVDLGQFWRADRAVSECRGSRP